MVSLRPKDHAKEKQHPVYGGDLALMGAQPAAVVNRVRELGWPGVVGNTDEVLWRLEAQPRQERLAPKLRVLPYRRAAACGGERAQDRPRFSCSS